MLIGCKEMAENNFLFYGDNLEVLRKHIKDETVDLCYIDPPFNSQRDYNQIYNNIGSEDQAQAQAFTDTWVWDEHAITGFDEVLSNEKGRFTPKTVELIKGLRAVLGEGSLLAYLVSLTLRVTEIHRILKPTGNFFIHCDPTASHYLKLMLDGIFCSQGGEYQNEIVWKRTSSHNDSHRFASIHDCIFYYTKSKDGVWNPQYSPHNEKYLKTHYNRKDKDGRNYRLDNIIRSASMGPRPNLAYEYKGYTPQWGWRMVLEKVQAIDEANRLEWSKSGIPYLVRYLDEQQGAAMPSIWDDIPPINSQAAERLGYPTQKPLALLERIIKAASNEGDVVMDAYCGCGTTIDAAQKLKRRWIGIDITYQSIAVVLKRLEDTYGQKPLDNIVLNGIPKDIKSAKALAHKKDDRLRKEFEKWAVLTYTNNRARINEKKGADAGIDGTGFFKTGKYENAKIIFQVKSGGVGRKDIASLRGDMEKTDSALALLITLEEPTKPMLADAKAAGVYKHAEMGKNYDRISIITIQDILEKGKRLEIPMSLEVLKAAQKAVKEEQLSLLL